MYLVYFLIWWFSFQGKSSLSRTDIEGVFALYDRVTLAIVIYKLSSQFFYSMKHQKEHRMCSSLVFSEKTLHPFSLSMKWSSFSKITKWLRILSLVLQHYKQSLHTYIPLQDNSGVIENEELSGFLKDLLELVGYNHVKALVVGEEPQIQDEGNDESRDRVVSWPARLSILFQHPKNREMWLCDVLETETDTETETETQCWEHVGS